MGSTSTLRSRGDESPRLSSKFHPPLPAGRPTDIQHEIPTSMFPPRTGYQAGVNPKNSFRSSYSNLTDSSHNATDGLLYNYNDNLSHGRSSRCCSPTYGRRNLSKCLNANVASKLAVEATKRSTLLAERRPPSPASSQAESRTFESPKMGGSFLRESQPFIARHGQGSLESLQSENQNQRWKTDKATPHTQPGRVSPLLSQKSSSSPSTPASSAKLNHAAISQSPVLDPRHYRGSSPTKNSPVLHHYQPPLYTGDHKSIPALYDDLFAGSLMDSPELSRRFSYSPNPETVSWSPPGNSSELCDFRTTTAPAYSPSNKEVYHRKAEGIKTSLDYQTQVRSLSKSEREEGLDHSGGAGTSSQSSSGVTGSMGDSQLDRNESPSPETSSQCSHDTADTGSGIQSDGSSTATPSSRSQRIAQAKWDFLFGGPPEESCCRQEAPPSTPPPSVAPSPSPRSSLRHKTTNQWRGRDIEAPKVTHHKTIKYSETDLDAVPLRCYRETDLDEVRRPIRFNFTWFLT
ncbi:PH and SEC7 domain containing protein 1 [Dissostichus eleginoides]|uniref:PH and SEC7 domain containing protein 1 n=1 Tax=Dissostichus eleginoides TaxID=100907 RepID=A0AAD9CRD6_DISEL|nr:PH and SEC7 domain containing protein 1 [Dissostichus eleginoides]